MALSRRWLAMACLDMPEMVALPQTPACGIRQAWRLIAMAICSSLILATNAFAKWMPVELLQRWPERAQTVLSAMAGRPPIPPWQSPRASPLIPSAICSLRTRATIAYAKLAPTESLQLSRAELLAMVVQPPILIWNFPHRWRSTRLGIFLLQSAIEIAFAKSIPTALLRP